MRIQVDQESCVGAGRCAWAAPEVFDQDEDGFVVLLDPGPPTELADRVYEAVTMCPARAIDLDETAGQDGTDGADGPRAQSSGSQA
ncbi:ferredoxin [Streptomyces sp. NPDC057565]|uniref:ferredoxin n=1 Tax=Streptomyces sp. NPDC057565 TaxID=3346169 RepID=UPI003696F779